MTPQETLQKVLAQDQFDDSQKMASLDVPYYFPEFVEFVVKQSPASPWLDIGCGTGGSFAVFDRITHAVEPNPIRRKQALFNGGEFSVAVSEGYAEKLPFDSGSLQTVSYFRGFFQCRSDAEALIEINRVLSSGGLFLVDVPERPTVFGRAWCPRTFPLWVRQFGFHLIEQGPPGETVLYSFRRVCDFGPECYLKPQLIPLGGRRYGVNNFSSLAYWAKPSFQYEVEPRRSAQTSYAHIIKVLRGKVGWELL